MEAFISLRLSIARSRILPGFYHILAHDQMLRYLLTKVDGGL